MLPGGNRTICMIWHMFLGLDLFSTCTDLAQHLITAATGCAIDYLDDLDRDLAEVYIFLQ